MLLGRSQVVAKRSQAWYTGAVIGHAIHPRSLLRRVAPRRAVVLEVEAKFSIPDESAFQRLLETTSLGGFSLGGMSVLELHDTYLDTERQALRGGGYAYRLRRSDDGYLATVKGLGGAEGVVHRRVEHELALAEPLPPQEWPPSAARDLVLRLCGKEPLQALFTIRQTRHSRLLRKRECSLAELNLDRVAVGQGGIVVANYLELEAELLPEGCEQDLEELAVELQGRWRLVPEIRSKYERALALLDLEAHSQEGVEHGMCTGLKPQDWGVGRQPGGEREAIAGTKLPSSSNTDRAGMRPSSDDLVAVVPGEEWPFDAPGITPDDPMSEAGRKTFRFHYLRMLYHEPGTRRGKDIEALHDMRVATRRMRAAFHVFGDYFAPEVVAPYLKGLRRTGRALGAVRDLDVFRAKTQTYIDTLPESKRAGLDRFLTTLEARREEARAQMLVYLDSKNYYRFVRSFGVFVETEGMGGLGVTANEGEPRPYRVRHVAPMAIYERLAAVRAYDEWVSVPDPPLPRLHALRIACKRLRYTLEFFSEVLGADHKPLVKEVVTIQDLLGGLQDAVVASCILRGYLVWGTWGENAVDNHLPDLESSIVAPGVAAYLAARQDELKRLLDAFPQAWRRLNGGEFLRMVAMAVSAL
jgi:CHAD domain-containing protein